jgi:hypothetical protein
MSGARPVRHALAGVALVFLAVMVYTGARPRQQQFVAYEAAGVLDAPPAEVRALEVTMGGRHWQLARTDGAWQVDGAPLTETAGARLEVALKVLHSSRPVRVLRGAAASAEAGEYGLAEPTLELALRIGEKRRFAVAFGGLTPDAGLRYLRVAGTPDVQLVSTFVHDDWQAFAEALRGGP